MIYNFSVFDRHWECVFYAEWHSAHSILAKAEALKSSIASSIYGEDERSSGPSSMRKHTINSDSNNQGEAGTIHSNLQSQGPDAPTSPYHKKSMSAASAAISAATMAGIGAGNRQLLYDNSARYRSRVNTTANSQRATGDLPNVSSPRTAQTSASRSKTSPNDSKEVPESTEMMVWPNDDNENDEVILEHVKLVYGVAYSLRNIMNKLKNKDGSRGGNPGGFEGFTTANYKLNYFESPSGVRFILTTDPHCGSMKSVLEQLYAFIYVEYVIKNPLFVVDPKRSVPIKNDYFKAVVDSYIRSLKAFSS
ncbi:TRAPP complex subunit bet5 [Mycoemilia scoparia]|uniref:TRAPP complex subunit bet5 n=1 Tax=Mycoemilia scoparia TaxID=417184 RepID=A0A9W8AA46_9FUNG|nr:TRAPP complex subunit bet5 [Mycoemilia scoparia]